MGDEGGGRRQGVRKGDGSGGEEGGRGPRKGDGGGGEEGGRGRGKEMEGEVRREAGGEERRWRGR